MSAEKALDVNRSLLFVTAKQPLLNWLQSLPNPFDVTLEEINEDRTAYLIPEYLNETDLPGIVRALYQRIFSRELEAWWEEEAAWPDITDFDLFGQWFNIEAHSAVADLAPAPIGHQEERGEPTSPLPASPAPEKPAPCSVGESSSGATGLLGTPELRSGLWVVSWVLFAVFNMGMRGLDWAMRDHSSTTSPAPGGLPESLDYVIFATPFLLAVAVFSAMPRHWTTPIRVALAIVQFAIACFGVFLSQN